MGGREVTFKVRDTVRCFIRLLLGATDPRTVAALLAGDVPPLSLRCLKSPVGRPYEDDTVLAPRLRRASPGNWRI